MTRSLLSEFYGVPEADPERLEQHFELFIAHLERRRRNAQPITIIIDGRETGVGK